MAQMQPRSGQSQPMSDLMYDLVTELSNCGQAVTVLDEYIEDARSENAPEVQRLFEQIREDEMRHCQMLRDCMRNMVQQGKI